MKLSILNTLIGVYENNWLIAYTDLLYSLANMRVLFIPGYVNIIPFQNIILTSIIIISIYYIIFPIEFYVTYITLSLYSISFFISLSITIYITLYLFYYIISFAISFINSELHIINSLSF